MANEKVLSAWINPLEFLEVDEPWSQLMKHSRTHEEILRYLCTPGIGEDVDSCIRRYWEISKEQKKLFAAPLEEHIMGKLVWPLRHAKGCYMVGNYLGTVALCGMVAEMVAILLFEIANVSMNGRLLDKKAQRRLFGSDFERLGQDRRVEVLREFNVISDKLKSSFDTIREKRRRYLHFYSEKHDRLTSDAVEVFLAAVEIVVRVIGQEIKHGKLMLNPALLRYLEQKGALKVPEEGSSEENQEG